MRCVALSQSARSYLETLRDKFSVLQQRGLAIGALLP